MSDKIKDGGAAFPIPACPEIKWGGAPGMTLRDYFAGQALAGGISNLGLEDNSPKDVAIWSYEYADAMIAAREGGL